MDAEGRLEPALAERARHAAELEERDRKIAAQEDALASDHELIARLSRIIRDCSAPPSAPVRRSWIPSNSRWRWRTSAAGAGPPPRCAWRRRREAAKPRRRAPTEARCRAPAAGRTGDRTSRTRPAPAAAARCTGSARVTTSRHCRATMANAERLDVIPATFRALVIRRPKYGCERAKRWWCRPGAGAPDRGRACRRKPPSPTSWSPSTPITRRFIDSPDVRPPRASCSIARPSRTGPARRPSS